MRKLIALMLLLFMLTAFLPALAESTTESTTVEPAENDRTSLLISLAGDCILGTDNPIHGEKDSFVGVMRANGNDYSYPLKLAQQYFANDDFTLVNLECMLTDKEKYIDDSLWTNFRGPAAYVNILTEGSVEGVSMSNNHALDFKVDGLWDCQKNLDNAGVLWAYNTDYFTFEKDDVKVAVFSFRRYFMEKHWKWIETEFPRIKEEEGVDFIIICLHHGTEYQEKHNDEEQTRFAHHAIDYGADLVVGTHPHVLQGIEVYKNRLILYSIGNFSFGGNKQPKPPSIPTAVFQVNLEFDESGLYSSQLTIHPYHATGTQPMNNYQPTPVTGEDAQEVMDILQNDTPFTLNAYVEGEGAVQDIIYANAE